MDKKQLKVTKESIQKSISNAETSLALSMSEGNKRATDSAQRVLNRLKAMLEDLKGAK
jgi:hypothetical protein